MCEQTEILYVDGEVVWVKLGSCWWPGEVVAADKLPPDVLPSFRKPPIAVVKFFQEDAYEYVKNINSIYKYNCSRKTEFINKGLYMYRTKHGHMEKFPEDVIRAETAVGGDIQILTRGEFQEAKKESYAGLFGDPKKTPASSKKGKGKGRPSQESPQIVQPIRKMKEKTDYKVHILVQGPSAAKPTEKPTTELEILPCDPSPTPSTSAMETNNSAILDFNIVEEDNDSQPEVEETPVPSPSTPTLSTIPSSGGIYACHACPFSTSRLNVLIMHNKTHSVSFVPYTPSPVRKKPVKSPPKASPNPNKTPKPRKPRAEKPIKIMTTKRASEEKPIVEIKKQKTDEEIKSSLLADWDDGEEDSIDESTTVTSRSPEVAIGAESPAVPSSSELSSAQVPDESLIILSKKTESSPSSEKPESSSDSKYDFCEDEDWPVEADAGRKIPRVKNPKRTEETKSLSLDDDEMSKEVAELLNKTAVPELPSIPESLKVEENFPEPSVAKSPDKKVESETEHVIETVSENAPPKAIFKTKTFFRSRHSRSQDAIGKYVAEQLNAVERMDITDCELNGSEVVSSPEARDSPPIEQDPPTKVARLAPKIQLKKMKAEALREKEKNNSDILSEVFDYDLGSNPDVRVTDAPILDKEPETEVSEEIRDDNTEILLENSSNHNDEALSTQEPIVENVTEELVENNGTHIETEELPSKTIEEFEQLNRTDEKDEINNEIKLNDDQVPEIELTENMLPGNEEPTEPIVQEKEPEIQPEHYMNESTASAVDALLSVSREADRVTRIISDDPPEDLFEDDNGSINSSADAEHNANIDPVYMQNGFKQVDNEAVVANDVMAVESNNMTESNEVMEETVEESQNNLPETTIDEEIVMHTDPTPPEQDNIVSENIPSESDLQIAEALINLPATAIQKSKEICQNVEVPMTFDTETHEEVITESSDVIEEEIKHHEEVVICENDKIDDVSHKQVVDELSHTNVSDEISHTNIVDDISHTQLKDDVSHTQLVADKISHTQSVTDNDNLNDRYETEQEKSENLNAAQSLVQMSEYIDHKVNVIETVTSSEVTDPSAFIIKSNNSIDTEKNINKSILVNENNTEPKLKTFDAKNSKLLKILEEPSKPKLAINKTKPIIMQGKEKILNFDVAKNTFNAKPAPAPKQKIIIRRTAPGKNLINNINDVSTGQEKIILSRTGSMSQDGSVQTYTIQTKPDAPSDANTIIIQQKIRKFNKPPTKLTKIKPQMSLVAPQSEIKPVIESSTTDDAMFDINSMPIVLSEDLLTPESIEKMPVVMSDANIITQKVTAPKVTALKPKTVVENEKISITSAPPKQEIKTLLVNPISEVSKSTTPNILSKSAKLRGAKPMLVIDKTTGKQKIIMTKPAEPIVREVSQSPTIIQAAQSGKSEKFLILPSQNSPRPGRTQKIVIDPQTGKAHMIMAKSNEPTIAPADNKPVSAKLMPSNSDSNVPGNTVMIITNAQGAQSRIVLTPEHEKILFPNKQQPCVPQLKTVAHRMPINSTAVKTIITASSKPQNIAPVKTPTRIVPKQKSAIITSKGQLIVGGRVATTAQNIAPMPELRPVTKRVLPSEPKKLVQKTSSEPIIFLQQKSGAVMQLTAAQFEHLQRTGQIVQKTVPAQEKVIIQKNRTIEPKQRIRKAAEPPTPPKKIKKHQEIVLAPAPAPPPLTTLVSAAPASAPAAVPGASHTVSVASSSAYPDFDNFEELLPSTAIARPEPAPSPPAPEPAPAPLSDGLLAVPGEHFGGHVGTFYLCIEENGTFTPIDNRPLVLENNQLVPMGAEAAAAPERRDILEAALANSDVFHAEAGGAGDAPDFRDLNANVSVHCRVSETSSTLHQPIMSPLETPSRRSPEPPPASLEAGLAVIGVAPPAVPTTLELPITVTDPRIAPRAPPPPPPPPPHAFAPPSISMPLLTDEEPVGKSMPILTDDALHLHAHRDLADHT